MYIKKNNSTFIVDSSSKHLKDISNFSKDISPNEKKRIKGNYFDIYNDFINFLRTKNVTLNIDNSEKVIYIKDFLVNCNLIYRNKIVYKNKKYKYNSIKLYNKILNKECVSYNIFNKVKFNIIAIKICEFFCDFMNNKLELKNSGFVIYDKLNNLNYKVVNNLSSCYNIKDDKILLPPIIPMKF